MNTSSLIPSSKVSIIIPVYNVEKYIHRCINSVLSQTYTNWEAILIDDGSLDNCPQICDDYASRDTRFKVIHKHNGGLSSARNAGLDIISGEYLMFLDSDDFIHCETLMDICLLAEYEDADIVQFSYIRGKSNKFPLINKCSNFKVFDNRNIFYSRVQKIILCGKLYKSNIWKNIRMPIGKINEDDATTWKLYYKSTKIVYINTPYYYYYENPDSIMGRQKKEIKLDFIDAYNERIIFFENKNDKLLTDLSRWRFCLPLMISYAVGNVKRSDLPIILDLFRKNVGNVISCPKVPFAHKVILSMFRICPSLYRHFFVLCGKAHNL